MTVLDELLVRFGVDMSDAEDEVDRGSQGILDRLGGLEVAGGAAAGLLGKAFSDGLEYAMDATAAETKLQNQLGLTDDQADRAGRLAGQVFSSGFGESIDGVDEALGAVSQNLGGFADLSDQQLVQLTKDAQGLADTFEFDVGESTQAAGQLMKAGLAKDGTEAFDLLTRAAQELPPAMREELPDVTKEYSGFFQQIGATGPQMFGILTEAAKNPLFELDKLGDAVKEFTLRISSTAQVKQPLEQLGLSVGHIQKLVNTGHGTQAFDEVNDALSKVTDQTKRTAIQSALFGGPGEDMANTLKAISDQGGFAGAKLDNVSGAAKKVTDNMASSPGQAWDSIWRTVTVTMGNMLMPVLGFVADLLQKYPGLLQILVPIVLALAAGLAIAAAAQWAMTSAILANPVTWIIVGIVALIAAIVLIATKTTWFQTIWRAVWGGLKTAFQATIDFFKGLFAWFGTLPGKFRTWFEGARNAAVVKLVALIAWVGGLPGRFLHALASLGSSLASRASSAFQSMRNAAASKAVAFVSWVRGLPGKAKDALGALGSYLYNSGRALLRGFVNGIKAMGGEVKNAVSGVLHSARNMLPFSPAKEGPFSGRGWTLYSGHSLMEGLAQGIDDRAGLARTAMSDAVGAAAAGGRQGSLRTSLTPGMTTAPSGGPAVRVVFDGRGEPFMDWLKERIRVEYSGDVTNLNGGR